MEQWQIDLITAVNGLQASLTNLSDTYIDVSLFLIHAAYVVAFAFGFQAGQTR